eukprot:GILJ01011712.1.p1 GENE.GILJ01011712.1~~GILJ01011712.1.p1  ORF type:complete len:664 (-),score=53.98 GILJ01011712.1:118-2109(-)
MGVKGLSRYVYQRGLCSERIDLTDACFQGTHICIDGNAFAYWMYFDVTNLSWIPGGQYSEFMRATRQFVHDLRHFSIQLTFFFDGLVEPLKKQTTLVRMNEMLSSVRDVCHRISNDTLSSYQGHVILPPLCLHLLRQVLLDEEIDVHVCLYEADRELARFAREHKCFVMSNDSDFFIMDIPGFIPLRSVKLLRTREVHEQQLQEVGSTYIDTNTTTETMAEETGPDHLPCHGIFASVFKRVHLAALLHLPVDSLPLFACLVGNDYLNMDSVHGRIFSILGMGRKLAQRRANSREVIDAVVKFIRANAHCDEFEISSQLILPPRKRHTLHEEQRLRDFCMLLTNAKSQYDLSDPVATPTSPENQSDIIFTQLFELFKTGKLAPDILRIGIAQEFWQPMIVECTKEGTAYDKVTNLTNILCALILRERQSPECHSVSPSAISGSTYRLTYFCPVNRTYQETTREFSCCPIDSIPPLSELLLGDVENRRCVFFHLLECTSLVADIRFARLNQRDQIVCLILSIMFRIAPELPLSIRKALILTCLHDESISMRTGESLPSRTGDSTPVNPDLLHAAALFQIIHYHLYLLHQLLQLGEPALDLTVWNGLQFIECYSLITQQDSVSSLTCSQKPSWESCSRYSEMYDLLVDRLQDVAEGSADSKENDRL